jgi:hypothetical protein
MIADIRSDFERCLVVVDAIVIGISTLSFKNGDAYIALTTCQ